MSEETDQIIANAMALLTGGCEHHKRLTFYEFMVAGGCGCAICLTERNRLLSDIALSAHCLVMNIENGFTPSLHAIKRDLGAFHARFGQPAREDGGKNNERTR